MRGELLSVREQTFVEAARALGARPSRLFARHALPHLLPSVAVNLSFGIGTSILTESALSFLGFGVQPDHPASVSNRRGHIEETVRTVLEVVLDTDVASADLVVGARVDYRGTTGDPPFYARPFIELRGIPLMRYQGDRVGVAERLRVHHPCAYRGQHGDLPEHGFRA